MKKITLDQLSHNYACSTQVSLFEQYFGEEVEVTLEGAIKVAQIFNWDWAARNLLNEDQYKSYVNIIQPAWEAYEAAKRPAQEAYEAAIQPAQEAYEAAIQPAQEAYEAAKRPALEAYKAVEQSTQEVYNRAKAEAFAKFYIQ